MDSNKKDWIETYAKFGYAAKGLVYFITGSLTAAFALEIGGQKASNTESLRYLFDLPGGSFLLGTLAFGLLGYSSLKFIQAFRDTEHKGTEAKGLAKRAAFFFSGLVYTAFAYAAIKLITGSSQNSSGGSNRKAITAGILNLPYGEWIVILIGLITIGNGLYQIKKGVSGSYMKDVSGLSTDQRKYVKKAGKVGFVSRGIVFAIIGFLFIQAGWLHNASKAEGTEGAFTFLQTWPFGSWLLAAVAIGLMAYGAFMFIQAKYSNVSIS